MLCPPIVLDHLLPKPLPVPFYLYHMQRTVTGSASISLEQQLIPQRGFYFGIVGQVTEHDYIEGRKWGTGIPSPHVEAA